MNQDFENTIMQLGVNVGMLAHNDYDYINQHILDLCIMYKNGADKIQLQYYILKYIN